MSFLQALNFVYINIGDGNETQHTEPCVTNINHQEFHLWLMLPSTIMIVLMSFTLSRKNKFLSCFQGRPGAVFPMDILGRSNRFSYAAAWGAIAYLATDMVFEQKFAVRLEGKSYLTAINGLLSMLIYGVDYFPLFASLAMDSVAGYVIGTCYAWMLFSINIFKATECDLVYQARLILILRDIPNLLCLGYLCLSLPIRTIQSLRHDSGAQWISSNEMVSILRMSKDMDITPEGIHVKKLLRRHLPPPPEPTTLGGKVMGILKGLADDWVYSRHHNFRYSSRIISVMLIGIILLYKTTVQVMTTVLAIYQLVLRGFLFALDEIGDTEEGEDPTLGGTRDFIYVSYYLVDATRTCFIVAITIAVFSSLLSILHMLSSYRTNLFDLYKGDNTHIPHRDTRSNASLLVGSMRYAGYQVGYIAWGWAIQFLILFIVAVALATVIIFIMGGYYQWIIDILLNVWPVLLVTIFVTFGQLLVAKFAFLQERGNLLAIDNRRVLFSFTFFLFFYNTFIGFLSCLLRIVKSIAIGALFLARLDNSALPRRFQMFDPGFAAYVGFITVEAVHTHPVLVCFLKLLVMSKHIKDGGYEDKDNISVKMNGDSKYKMSFTKPRVNTLARNRWLLFYTLHNNPAVRATRKQYIVYMKEMREHFARRYNMNNTAMGALMKGMGTTMSSPIGVTDIAINNEMMGEVSQAQMNWNATIGMNRFMMNMLKKDNVVTDDDNGMEMDMMGQHNLSFSNDFRDTDQHEEVQVKSTRNLWKKAAKAGVDDA